MKHNDWQIISKAFLSILLVWSLYHHLSRSQSLYESVGLYLILFVALAAIYGLADIFTNAGLTLSARGQLFLWLVLVAAIILGTQGFQTWHPGWQHWLFWGGILTFAYKDGISWLFRRFSVSGGQATPRS